MIYMKHKEHGNIHCDASKQSELEAQGYVRFPHGDDKWVQSVAVAEVSAEPEVDIDEVLTEQKRRGRPPKG